MAALLAAVMLAAGVWVPAPRFAQLPSGWTQLRTPGVLTIHGANASAYALSWKYRPTWDGWASHMPRGGIAVTVLLIRREPGSATGANLCRTAPHLPGHPPRRLPLHLPATTTATLEGAPGTPEYRVFGRFRDSYAFEVRVDIRDPHPTAALLATARRVVAGIVFPLWPSRTHC